MSDKAQELLCSRALIHSSFRKGIGLPIRVDESIVFLTPKRSFCFTHKMISETERASLKTQSSSISQVKILLSQLGSLRMQMNSVQRCEFLSVPSPHHTFSLSMLACWKVSKPLCSQHLSLSLFFESRHLTTWLFHLVCCLITASRQGRFTLPPYHEPWARKSQTR